MAATKKVSVEALAERRRLEALAGVVAWMGDGQPPLTKAELRAARRELASRRGSVRIRPT